MGIFALIYVIVLLLILHKSKNFRGLFINLTIYLCVLDIVFDRGVFVLGNLIISCASITRLILLILAVRILIRCNRINCRYLVLSFAFIGVIILGFSYEVISPYEENVISDITFWDAYAMGKAIPSKLEYDVGNGIKQTMAVISYVLMAYVIKIFLFKDELYRIVIKIYKYSRILIYYGVLEFLIRNLLGLPNVPSELMSFFLGDERLNYATIGYRGSFFMTMGFQAEPSQFTQELFIIAVVGLVVIAAHKFDDTVYSEYPRTIKFDYACIFIMMVLSGSLSSIWYILIILILAIKSGRYKKTFYHFTVRFYKKIAIVMGMILLLVIPLMMKAEILKADELYLYERLNTTIDVIGYFLTPNGIEKLSFFDSSVSRFISIYEVGRYALDRPLLGLGIGSVIAHDSTISMLANFGIVGFCLFFLLLITSVKTGIKYDNAFAFVFAVVSFLPMGSATLFGYQIFTFIIIESTCLYVTKT